MLPAFILLACCHAPPPSATKPLDPRFTIGPLLFTDPFTTGTARWTAEIDGPGGRVSAANGKLEIDVPAGCTLWLNQKLDGPVLIEYKATVLTNGGPNDRLSDLNCFWMADDSRSPGNLFATPRTGKFADYDLLKTYYVGLGGNSNTTTRFRRYIGQLGDRPLDPANDLSDPPNLLVANQPQTIQLVACHQLIQFYRNGKRLFEMNDPHPYTTGWFAFRTTHAHLLIQDFKIYGLQ